mgnify:FL=1
MKIVIDTNVFISGIFFSGPPFQILEAWRDDKVQVIISPQIMDEYRRVAEIISKERPIIELTKIIDFLIHKAELIEAPDLPESVCEDSDDDKFLACALASGCKLIVSGDKHLLKVTGYREIEVLKPKAFLDKYLA